MNLFDDDLDRIRRRVSCRAVNCRLFPLLLAAAAALASCSRHASDAGKSLKPDAAAVPVLVGQATSQDVPVEIQAIGNAQPYSMVAVRPQLTGAILQVHFEEGREVKAGDLLFTLDPRPWTAALNQAQANLMRDQAQLINARLNFERTSNLLVLKISSQQDFDAADAAFQAAQNTVLADAAAITNAQVNLDYTYIRAPIDGRTGNLAVKAGNVVKAPDDVLVTITQIRPIYVTFSVPKQNLPTIRRRANETQLSVEAFAPNDRGHVALGKLTFIDNMVDTNTGRILLKATFPNSDHLLWPGQFLQTTLTLSNLTQATVVPTQAVQTGQNGEFVFVMKPDLTVDARPVVAGITYNGVRVIQSGVQPGETVITDGQLRLTPGAKVSVKTLEAGEAPTNSAGRNPS